MAKIHCNKLLPSPQALTRLIVIAQLEFVAAMVIALLFLPHASISQPGNRLFTLPQHKGKIQLDGMSDEPAWQEIAPLLLTMHTPSFGKSPSERSEIRIAYDQHYLYAAGRFYDADPSGVHGNLMRRDEWSGSDDEFAVILDTYNDNQNAVVFVTSPAGKRTDVNIFNDAVPKSGVPWDVSWNTFWDVEVVRNHEGWFAEMRIPFSSLRFQEQNGKVVMGLIVWRWIARKNETDIYPAIPPNWPNAFLKPSLAQRVALEGINRRNPVYLTPYILGGFGHVFELDHRQTVFQRINNTNREAGMDLKYRLTSNLALDVTVNTDFAQVEADDQRINLTRFSLFFPEKRQFFLERPGIFSFNTGGFSRLFYSRRLGLSSDGKPIRIYGGARMVGRLGNWDIGALDMQTARTAESPTENLGVLRVRRSVLNDFSNVGGMITSRVRADGKYNLAYGLDSELRLFGEDFLYLQWAQTFDDSTRVELLQRTLLRLSWERNSTEGPGYKIEWIRSGKKYDPGLGFIERSDFTFLSAPISYGWTPKESSVFQKHKFALENFVYLRHADESIESAEVGPTWNGDTKSGEFFRAGIKMMYEDLLTPLALSSDAVIPSGHYMFYNLNASYNAWGKIFYTGVTLDAGSFHDGSRFTLGLTPSWQVSRFLEVTGFLQFNRIRFPNRDQRFDGKIARLRAEVALTPGLTLSNFVQWNSEADVVSVNVRFRYNVREGNDLYLVYNEGLNTERSRAQPALPLSNTRAILTKYTHTFDF